MASPTVPVFKRGSSGDVDAYFSILLRILGFLRCYFRLPTPEDPELGVFIFVRRISTLCCPLRHGFPVPGSRRGWHGHVCDHNNSLCAGHVRRRRCKATRSDRTVGGTPSNL